MVWAELCLQLPFFFVAVKALYDRDEAAFRIPFVIYGAHTATTMIPILGEICGSAAAPPRWFRSVVWGEICLQLPFFFVAVKALYDRDETAFRIPFIVYGAHTAV